VRGGGGGLRRHMICCVIGLMTLHTLAERCARSVF